MKTVRINILQIPQEAFSSEKIGMPLFSVWIV